MKIALYLAGHLRTWNNFIKDKLRNFIKGYDVDIFISTHNSNNRTEMRGESEYKILKEYSDEEVKSLFEGLPVKNIDIDSDKLPHPYLKEENAQYYSWRMWRKVWKCNEMRKQYEKDNNITYDYVIRMRPDIIAMELINFESLPKLDRNIIIGFGTTLGYPDDMFAISSPKVMDHYCDISKTDRSDSAPHEIVKFTIKIYPIFAYLQLGILRNDRKEEPGKYIDEIDGLFLNYYLKNEYGH